MTEELKDLPWEKLQALAKEHGVKANLKKEEMIARLEEKFNDKEEKEEDEFTPEAMRREKEEVKQPDPEPKETEKTEAAIMSKGKVVRIYSKEKHGKEFLELAKKYVATHDELLNIELR